ncbi:MAG: hypothetical protein ACRC2U_19770 [Aeromonas sp.]
MPYDPWEAYQAMRTEVAKEHGFKLYGHYSEAQAAHYLKCDPSTLKRRRLKGQVLSVELGGQVKYLGIMIADMLLGGAEKWGVTLSENTSSVTSG